MRKEGADRIKYLKETNLLNQSISNQFLIESKFLDADPIDHNFDNVEEIVEHKKLNYISYLMSGHLIN